MKFKNLIPSAKGNFPASSFFADFRKDMEAIFNNFHRISSQTSKEINFMPSLDFSETSTGYHARVELAGIAPENVKLEINDNILTVSGEKNEKKDIKEGYSECFYGKFSRSISLPNEAEIDQIKSKLVNGALEIDIPLKKGLPDKKHRVIQIEK